jgi:hypothetical protein
MQYDWIPSGTQIKQRLQRLGEGPWRDNLLKQLETYQMKLEETHKKFTSKEGRANGDFNDLMVNPFVSRMKVEETILCLCTVCKTEPATCGDLCTKCETAGETDERFSVIL